MQGIDAISFLDSSIPVNMVSGPMGIVFTGYLSDPGGALVVGGPDKSDLSNSELAAQQYLAYVQGGLAATPLQIALVSASRHKAISIITRGTAGSDRFWTLVDTADAIAATMPPFPYVQLPPPRPAPLPPRPQPPPGATASQNAPNLTLPPHVNYIGCFKDNTTSRILPIALTTAAGGVGDRANSVDRCMVLAAGAASNNSTQRIMFLGLQRFQCFGGESVLRALKAGQLQETACPLPCPGVLNQKCGGMPIANNAVVVPISIYRVVLPTS